MRLITNAEALQRELDSLSLVGCRVLTFDVVGRLHGLTRQSMLDFYNVCMAPEGGDVGFQHPIQEAQHRSLVVEVQNGVSVL